ncbi:MAG: hypothetical protein HUU35_14930 [Armatimonadetes bacterium]|nr:hypothetical protein [Armatimonadota bacterium]
MRLGRWVVVGLAGVALAGCSRPGPSALPVLPAALQTLYQQAQAAPSAAAWTAVARGEANRHHWTRAVAAYQAALRIQPENFEALAELAGLRTAHGERGEATRLVLLIEKHHANRAAAQAVLGDLYGLLGRRELSLASYRRALALDPKQTVPLLRLGQDAFRRRKLGEARGYLVFPDLLGPDEVGALRAALDDTTAILGGR